MPPVEGVWGRPELNVNSLPLPLTPQATSRIWNSHQELEKDPNFLGRMLNHGRLLVPKKIAWPSFGAGSLNCHLGKPPSPHRVQRGLILPKQREGPRQFLWLCVAKLNCLLLILLYQLNINWNFKTSERRKPHLGEEDKPHIICISV